jgi:hypothetical protein
MLGLGCRLRQRIAHAVRGPACAAFALIVSIAFSAHAGAPFDGLLGAWSGSGQIRYESGDTEGVRCSAYYTGGGQQLRLAIRCRSTSNNIEIRGLLTQHADRISGTWEERTFNAAGEASGRMTNGRMNLSINGGGFSGSMTVSYNDARQTVVITTQGIPMKSVNVTLGKG